MIELNTRNKRKEETKNFNMNIKINFRIHFIIRYTSRTQKTLRQTGHVQVEDNHVSGRS